MKSIGRKPVNIIRNLQRPFWPQSEPVERTPELHASVHEHGMLHETTKQQTTFLFCLQCMFLKENCVAGELFLKENCVAGELFFVFSSPDDVFYFERGI